jgi:hypothetical protein
MPRGVARSEAGSGANTLTTVKMGEESQVEREKATEWANATPLASRSKRSE